MTYTPRAVPQNVMQSLRQRVLDAALGVPVQFGDSGQREEESVRWLDFTLQPGDLRFERQAAAGATGGLKTGVLAVGLNEKWPLKEGDNIYTLYTLLRSVLQLFEPGDTIQIKDYASGADTQAGLVEVVSVNGPVEVQDGRGEPPVRRWAVTVALQWIEEWS